MSTKKPSSSLGRGLGSLIPQKNSGSQFIDSIQEAEEIGVNKMIDETIASNSNLLNISVDRITPNPQQPRMYFSDDSLEELINSVREHGILQPIVVSNLGGGRFELIMGERRWRAAQRAGLMEIPAMVRSANDQEKLELALIENVVREDLNPLEAALAYKRYIEEFALTHEDASQRLGKSRSHITNSLRLLNLPDEVKNALRDKKISDAHAKVIVGLSSPDQQIALCRQIIGRGLSVARSRIETQKVGGTKKAKHKVDPQDEEMQKKLRQFLGTRASIYRTGYRGKIIIEFFNYDELVELVEKILGEGIE